MTTTILSNTTFTIQIHAPWWTLCDKSTRNVPKLTSQQFVVLPFLSACLVIPAKDQNQANKQGFRAAAPVPTRPAADAPKIPHSSMHSQMPPIGGLMSTYDDPLAKILSHVNVLFLLFSFLICFFYCNIFMRGSSKISNDEHMQSISDAALTLPKFWPAKVRVRLPVERSSTIINVQHTG